jgi:starvation-inducible DNA-binding protein
MPKAARVNETQVSREISAENQPDNPVVERLQQQLANAFVLYANYKHYHWATFGPLFRDLHLMFDEFATAILATSDELAERIRMIGQDVSSVQLRDMQEKASVRSTSAKSSMREMIEEADANEQIAIKNVRDGADAAEEQHDPGSVDLFSKIVQIHEKHEWFLREILKKRDGLTV